MTLQYYSTIYDTTIESK